MKNAQEPSFGILRKPALTKGLLVCLFVSFFALAYHTHSLTNPKTPTLDLQVIGNLRFIGGTETALRLLTFDGSNGAKLADVRVKVDFLDSKGSVICTAGGCSTRHGVATIKLNIPSGLKPGSYQLMATAKRMEESTKIVACVEVESPTSLLLTTDKPLYQPNQTIHLRLMALTQPHLRPAASLPSTITIKDPKGTLLFKKSGATSEFGIWSCDFQLADKVGFGTYSIEACVASKTTTKRVKVSRYRLPRFSVAIKTDREFYGPGEEVTGTVTARYTYGMPVSSGNLEMKLSTFIDEFIPQRTLTGLLNDQGQFQFKFQLPKVLAADSQFKRQSTIQLSAVVRDGAKHEQESKLLFPVTEEPLHVRAIAESGSLICGLENKIYILTSYADGRPAKTKVHVKNHDKTIETNEAGLGQVTIKGTKGSNWLEIEATSNDGMACKKRLLLRSGGTNETILLRTNGYLYEAAGKVEVTVHKRSNGPVFLDLVNRNIVLSSLVVETINGKGHATLSLPPHLCGIFELKAYEFLADNTLSGDVRVIYVSTPSRLKVSAKTDKTTYAPGETAKVEIKVTDSEGKPIRTALGLSAVDEAVFALTAQEPSLASLYFSMQRELLAPRVTQSLSKHRPLTNLVASKSKTGNSSAEQARTLIFSIAKGSGLPKRLSGKTYEERRSAARAKNKEKLRGLRYRMVCFIWYLYLIFTVPFFFYTSYRWLFIPMGHYEEGEVSQLQEALSFLCLSWISGFVFPALIISIVDLLPMAVLVTGVLVVVLISLWAQRKSVAFFKAVPSAARLDCMYTFISGVPMAYVAALTIAALCVVNLGPIPHFHRSIIEEHLIFTHIVAVFVVFALRTCSSTLAGSRFDAIIFIFFLLFLMTLVAVPFFCDNLCSAIQHAGVPNQNYHECQSVDQTNSTQSPSTIRIRKHFPETLFWNPQLITDENGSLSVDIPLADSITTWRLAMTANSQCGKLGGSTLPITVFKSFFVEPDMPPVVTQNDSLSLPIAVYNHSNEEQRVTVKLKEKKWFDFVGPREQSVTLKSKESTRLLFPIRVSTVGRHSLTVLARGARDTDGVERSVIVNPDGKKVSLIHNGRLSNNATHRLDIPTHAIDGASELLVDFYPSAFSQVLSGLENSLKKPYGCFEQTSSTTYPNVLILSYLLATKQKKPKVEKRARHLIDMGYQRLLTFEVSGGGFSWFGRQPASQRLTAYGLLEFSDMSKIRPVSPELIDRTRRWLMEQQKEDGGFGTIRETAYIAWALANSGERSFKFNKTLDLLASKISHSDDIYLITYTTNALLAAKDDRSEAALRKLVQHSCSDENGVYWKAKDYGVFYTRNRYLNAETTALATSALIKGNGDFKVIDSALSWLMSQRDGCGTWGATQSTIQVLRALLLSASIERRLHSPCNIRIKNDNKLIGTLTIKPEEVSVNHQLDLSQHLKKGTQGISIETDSDVTSVSYQLSANYYVKHAPDETPKKGKTLSLKVNYGQEKVSENGTVNCTIRVTSHRIRKIDMPLIDIGIPPAFEPHWQDLENLVKKRTITRFEVRGNRLYFYLQELKHKEELVFHYGLHARFPVRVKSPPSWIYPYYEPDEISDGNLTQLEVN